MMRSSRRRTASSPAPLIDLDNQERQPKRRRPEVAEPNLKSPELVQLDSHGDVTLTIKNGADHQSFRVSSHAMRLASPVWKAMLTGGFAESKKTEILLEDDDPDTLLVVLRAAHLQYRQLPKELTFDQVVNLAVICDKYDTATIIRPFLKKWTHPGDDEDDDEDDDGKYLDPGYEQWLSVAWTFGYRDSFIHIANYLARTSKMDNNDRCLNIRGQILGELLPTDILGTLTPEAVHSAQYVDEA
jgi:hypothetical protein